MKRIFFSLFMAISLVTFAKVDERTAKISHKLNGTEKIFLNLKKADVNISSNTSNNLEIFAKLTYRGSKITPEVEEFLNNFTEAFNTSLSANSNQINFDVSGITASNSKKYLFGLVVISSNEAANFDLDLTISLPGKQELTITHSYGDMTMLGNYKLVDLNQFSGDFKGDNFNKLKLTQKYGESSFQKIEDGTIELFSQDFELKKASFINLNAKYSDVIISETSRLHGEGFDTDYKLDTLQTLEGNYKYGQFEIGKVKQIKLSACFEQKFTIGLAENIYLKDSKYSKYNIGTTEKLESHLNFNDHFTISSIVSAVFSNTKYGNFNFENLGKNLTLSGFSDDITVSKLEQNKGEISIEGKYLDIEINTNTTAYSAHFNLQYGKVNIPNLSSLTILKDEQTSSKINRVLDVKTKNAASDFYKMSFTGFEVDVRLN